jgi:S-adenosylmethionine/arginine decarboxylase-like enzyme
MNMNTLVGQEYTIIGWCKNKVILQDQGLLQSLLEDICSRISMRSLGSMGVDVPVELEKLGQEAFEDEGGSTASLILSTSHASIHGWPKRDVSREDGGFFWFTVGSCRAFNVIDVDGVLDSVLHITHAHRSKRYVSLVDGQFISSTME